MNILIPLLAIATAAFCIYCAYKDFDWFMNNRKALVFVKLFGRNGARKFYMGFGVVIGIMGVVLFFSSFF